MLCLGLSYVSAKILNDTISGPSMYSSPNFICQNTFLVCATEKTTEAELGGGGVGEEDLDLPPLSNCI